MKSKLHPSTQLGYVAHQNVCYKYSNPSQGPDPFSNMVSPFNEQIFANKSLEASQFCLTT